MAECFFVFLIAYIYFSKFFLMMNRAMDIADSLLDLFYPAFCEGCSNLLMHQEDTLCLHCAMKMPKTNFNHLQNNPAFEKFIGRDKIAHAAAFAYFTKDGLLQNLMHRLKYKNRKSVAEFLGRLFANDIAGLDWVKNVEVILPVPLHQQKENYRGFNQSFLLAKAIGEALSKPVTGNATTRIINTPSQTNLSRAERIENVKNAFTLKNPEIIKNKNIFLIDDIITTGATVESCAAALSPYAKTISIGAIGIAID